MVHTHRRVTRAQHAQDRLVTAPWPALIRPGPFRQRRRRRRIRVADAGLGWGRGRQVNLYADGAAGIRFHSDPGAPRAQAVVKGSARRVDSDGMTRMG